MTRPEKEYVELREFYAEQGKRPCRKCNAVYDLDQFPNDKKGNRGKSSVCQPCQSERQRNRARRNFGIQGRLDSAVKRFRRAGKTVHPFSDDLFIKHMTKKRHARHDVCYYTGRPLQIEDKSDKSTFLELDHVKPMSAPRSTHSVGNVVPATKAFNNFKRDKRAVEAVMTAPEHLQPIQCFVGLAEGMAGVDSFGNPNAPARIEGWSDGDSPAITFYVPEDDTVGGDR